MVESVQKKMVPPEPHRPKALFRSPVNLWQHKATIETPLEDLTLTSRIPIFVALLLMLTGNPALPAGSAWSSDAELTGKRTATSSKLLLPYFEIDVSDTAPDAPTTFFSVRNETTQAVGIRISIFAPDSPQAPFFMEEASLAGQRLSSVNVRTKLAGQSGVVRGYVVVEADEPVIQGEYFHVDPRGNFANGSRLANIDPASQDNDLCSVFSVRFFNGGPFSGGTLLTFWLDLDVAPQGTDAISYAVYTEAGTLKLFNNLSVNEVVFQQSAVELTATEPTNFGVFEIQLNDGIRGHVAAVMTASGVYSVGLEAACRD